MGREEQPSGTRAFCDLDLRERDNLDADMTAMVRGIEKKYGFMPNFVKLFATDNRRLRVFMEQYMELMRPDSGLTQFEHELIALVSAATNGCIYCCAHHGALLRGETGDPMLAEYVGRNYRQADLSPRHMAMLDFAVKVLTDAEGITPDDRQALRDAGFDDEQMWTVISTASFYVAANRMSQAAGLKVTPGYLSMHR
jgi:uncharacterized peroxidase-related enzyme